jgi:amino acid transporter
MTTDLVFNLVLLMMSDYTFVLAISNVCYIIFNFMNLNAGWIHRLDRPGWTRPFRAPGWLLASGAVLSFVNLALLGLGADIWGAGTLLTGVVCAGLILPVFVFRHFIQDRGIFPAEMLDDMHLGREACVRSRAGLLPYLVLAAGVAVVIVSHRLAVVG